MSEEPVATIESPVSAEAVTFTDKHLEAAFAFKTRQHRSRILKAFGAEGELPALSNRSADVRIVESEKRFKKAYDLLRREEPAAIPAPENGMTKETIIAIADNLAWKGIENSIITEYLDEGEEVLRRLKNNAKTYLSIIDLERAERALSIVLIEDNHFYRDFFNSELARELGVDSPEVMEEFLKKASLNRDNSVVPKTIAKGLSLEIATSRHITDLTEGEDLVVSFGNKEEDRLGGDIVVLRDSSIVYFDIKSSKPKKITESAAQEGFSLNFDEKKQIYKAIVWPESKSPVARDSFQLNDVWLKDSIAKVLAATR